MSDFVFYAEPVEIETDTDCKAVVGAGEGAPDYLDLVYLGVSTGDRSAAIYMTPEKAIEVAGILREAAGVDGSDAVGGV